MLSGNQSGQGDCAIPWLWLHLSGVDISQGLFYLIKLAVREREKNQSYSTEGKR